MLRRVWATLSLLVLTSCIEGEPKFDTSSTDRYKATLAAVRKGLASERRAVLDEALMNLSYSTVFDKGDNIDATNPFMGLAKNVVLASMKVAIENNSDQAAEWVVAGAGDAIHGKTAEEVIRFAKEKELERLSTQLARLEADIAAMPAEIEQAEQRQSELDKVLQDVTIREAKYYWQDGTIMDEPVIEFRIKNNVDVALARVFFHGLLETPGRSVPWVDAGFNYRFRGGLEPGEEQHLRLAPNMFGDWGHQDLKDLASTILTLRVVDAETATGERLVPRDLPEIDELRERLRERQEARDKLKSKIDALWTELAG